MATSFTANQYQNAFVSQRLQNWEQPKDHTEKPRSLSGSTRIIATDKGHLLEGVPRSKKNPWGNFVGTWDLPNKIPGNQCMVNTARAPYAQDKLARQNTDASMVISGKVKNAQRSGVPDPCAVQDAQVTVQSELMRGSPTGAASPLPPPGVTSPAGSRAPSIPPKNNLTSPMPEPAPQGRSPSPPVKSPAPAKPDVAAL